MAFQLSACAELLWPDRQFEWRLRRLTEMGFHCGIWGWLGRDLDAFARIGATFSSMLGFLEGRLSDDEGADQLLATAKVAAQVSVVE